MGIRTWRIRTEVSVQRRPFTRRITRVGLMNRKVTLHENDIDRVIGASGLIRGETWWMPPAGWDVVPRRDLYLNVGEIHEIHGVYF